MKKGLGFFLSLTLVAPVTLSVTSCGTRKPGWQAPQEYWGLLTYSDFYDWMKHVDLITQTQWPNLTRIAKIQSWKTLNNWELNNFMTVMNLVYHYVQSTPDNDVKNIAKKNIDDLGGFYNNFGYALLGEKQSFAKHLLNLQKDDQFLIKDWSALLEENYFNHFKTTKLANHFEFHDSETGKTTPIAMTATTTDVRQPLDGKIADFWKPVAQATMAPTPNDSDTVTQKLWATLKNNHFSALVFKINLYWPSEDKQKASYTSFQFNLTFDF